MDSRAFLDFLKVAERLKCNTRHSYTSSGRHESVAEHSWRLTVMAYFMQDEFPEADIDKVIKMCMFHDMGRRLQETFLRLRKHPQIQTMRIM